MTRIEKYTLRLELINVAGIGNKDANVSYIIQNIAKGKENRRYYIFKYFLFMCFI